MAVTALTAFEEAAPFTSRQLDLIKTTIAPGVDDDQLALFVEVARRTGLDPFSRQIYAILRNAKEKDADGRWHTVKRMTIQTGIDGYRAIAARTSLLAGIDDATYGYEDTDGYPHTATVTVYRFVQCQRCAFTATARWSEYAVYKDEYEGERKTGKKVPSDMWARMPYLMLGKCAEALALRKAFPNEISGVYTAEEMAQADSDAPARYVEHAGRTVDAGTGEILRPVEESPDETIKRRIAEGRAMAANVPLGKPQASVTERIPLAAAEQGPKAVDPWQEVRDLSAALNLSDSERADLKKRHKGNREKILAELRERQAKSDSEPDITFSEPEPAGLEDLDFGQRGN